MSKGLDKNYALLIGVGEFRAPNSSQTFTTTKDIQALKSALTESCGYIVVMTQGKLKVYNQIYRDVFNNDWVEAELKSLFSDPKKDPYVMEVNLQQLFPSVVEEISEGLKSGDFCYVLSSPLTKKDEILREIKKVLEEDKNEFYVIIIDPNKIGRDAKDFIRDSERGEWYKRVARAIKDELSLELYPITWWKKYSKHYQNRKKKITN